jgi:1-aminocyclopropane-1-carboxylate deaminase/D-cysteine desulfhydrase-like pyridoxal-dependent ACC family enzyme
MTTRDISALTPVEYHEGIYFKRDDLFCPFTDIGVSGGKVRQCLLLVKKHLREIKKTHDETIATACSVHSPQGVIVARVAKKFGLRCLIGCGTASPSKHTALRLCKTLGAEVRTLVTANAYNAVLESNLDRLNKRRKFYPIRFGYQAEIDPDAIIDANAAQVRNIPREVTAVVIPVGSGVSAQGILAGIKRYRPTVKVFLIQPFGYDRKIVVPDGVTARYFTGKYDYARPLEITVDGFQLDEIYEAKSFDYMKRRLKRVLAKERVCFWVIGNANDMRHPVSYATS